MYVGEGFGLVLVIVGGCWKWVCWCFLVYSGKSVRWWVIKVYFGNLLLK